MSFIVYDLTFMGVFTLLVILFLYRKRKNLKRQGILYLYPTKLGINFIDRFSEKYHRLLGALQALVISCGYALMLFSFWLIGKVAYVYLSSPSAARDLKVPVLMPLVPYLPDLFNISYLPPFYFTYWIAIIAIIAIPHEFAHGIFARINKIKIHSTGFGFLGPFLAAFVEPDEKKMQKSKKVSQLSVLAAGTFANVIVAILFVVVMWIFFSVAFHPTGVHFDNYALSAINMSDINTINGIEINGSALPASAFANNNSLLTLNAYNKTYFISAALFSASLSQGKQVILAYDDAPAFKANLSGAIFEIDGKRILSQEDLREAIQAKKPGDTMIIKTKDKKIEKTYTVALAERDGKAYLGIGNLPIEKTKVLGELRVWFIKISDPLSYQKYINNLAYESPLGDLGIFLYYLIWWLILVNVSVAVMNMIPVGIFDGGRFFYLTIWGITGKEKAGEIAYRITTWAFLALVAAMMVKWAFVIW